FTSLYSFVGAPNDGTGPAALLVQDGDGNFYGTTFGGGTTNHNSLCGCNGFGTVFRISPSGDETDLYTFAVSSNDGADPYPGLVRGSDGNFYGTTEHGGTDGNGTVFRISPSGTYTSLYSFVGSSDGGLPL